MFDSTLSITLMAPSHTVQTTKARIYLYMMLSAITDPEACHCSQHAAQSRQCCHPPGNSRCQPAVHDSTHPAIHAQSA